MAHQLIGLMAKRSANDADLDRALALSLAEATPDEEALAWQAARERVRGKNRAALDHAIAASLVFIR